MRIQRSMERTLQRAMVRIGALDARLHSLSPLAVLDRGYALVINAEGNVVKSVAELTPNDLLTTRLADGKFTSRVEAKSDKSEPSN